MLLCNGDTCAGKDSDAVTVALRRALTARGLDPRVHTARTKCLGRCDDGCTVVVQPDNIWYREVTADIADRIVAEHLANDQPVTAHVSFVPGANGLEQVSGAHPGVSKPAGTSR